VLPVFRTKIEATIRVFYYFRFLIFPRWHGQFYINISKKNSGSDQRIYNQVLDREGFHDLPVINCLEKKKLKPR